jgi:CxxC motif-containing protein
LTTTVRVVDDQGVMIDMEPVRTAKPIPKRLLFDAMREIDALRVKLPIRRGDTLIRNLLDTGVDLIACKDLS